MRLIFLSVFFFFSFFFLLFSDSTENIFMKHVRANDIDSAKSMLEKGVKPEFVVGGMTPLWAATANGHVEMLKLLIKYGADVNAEKVKTWPPVAIAVYNNHLEAFKVLIGNGASVNFSNRPELNKNSSPIRYLINKEGKLLPWKFNIIFHEVDPGICYLHKVKRYAARVSVRGYGLPRGDDPYLIARRNLFPNSNLFALGGCMRHPDDDGTRIVFCCPVCRRLELEWGEDSDKDGISDKAEKKYNFVNGEDDSCKDNDNDCFSNYEEYRLATDFNDPKSHPPLVNLLTLESLEKRIFKLENPKIGDLFVYEGNRYKVANMIPGKYRIYDKTLNSVVIRKYFNVKIKGLDDGMSFEYCYCPTREKSIELNLGYKIDLKFKPLPGKTLTFLIGGGRDRVSIGDERLGYEEYKARAYYDPSNKAPVVRLDDFYIKPVE
jgi:hypothetical protein